VMSARNGARRIRQPRSAITSLPRRIISTFNFCRVLKATSGSFRAAATFPLESAAKANRRRLCANAWRTI
jgi:hypothetical protein